MRGPSESSQPTLTLSIVQLDHSIRQIDEPIEDKLAHVLDNLSCATPSDALKTLRSEAPSTKSEPCRELTGKVRKSVTRFRHDQDKWTSLTSLLLKSLAFYRSIHPTFSIPSDDPLVTHTAQSLKIERKKLPVVDIPRTKENRPYLPQLNPVQSFCPSETEKENLRSMMNVSHQYPWVCMAQQQLGPSLKTTKTPLVGVDLVVFDAKTNKFTTTIEEFLKCFQNSFTPWEWGRIQNYQCPSWLGGSFGRWFGRGTFDQQRSDASKLRDFFLRWAMKEAYTKAIGLGMSLNFDVFETKLYGVDLGVHINVDGNDHGAQEEGIWSSVMRQQNDKNGQRQFSVIGKVKHIEGLSSGELWEFIFIPLGDFDNDIRQGSTAHQLSSIKGSHYNACACICKGPLEKNDLKDDTDRIPTSIESLTLANLIEIHEGDQKISGNNY